MIIFKMIISTLKLMIAILGISTFTCLPLTRPPDMDTINYCSEVNKCAKFVSTGFQQKKYDQTTFASASDTPLETKIVQNLKVTSFGSGTNFAMKITGKLRIAQSGDYKFKVKADDQGQLKVGNLVTIQATVSSGEQESDNCNLSQGDHDIVFDFVAGGGSNYYHVQYKGPDTSNAWADFVSDIQPTDAKDCNLKCKTVSDDSWISCDSTQIECKSPPQTSSTNWCISGNQCRLFDGTQWSTTRSSTCENLCGGVTDGIIDTKCDDFSTCFNFDCSSAKIKAIADQSFDHNQGHQSLGGSLDFWVDSPNTCPIQSCQIKSSTCPSCFSFSGSTLSIKTDGEGYDREVEIECLLQNSYSKKDYKLPATKVKVKVTGCSGDTCPPDLAAGGKYCTAQNTCSEWDGLNWKNPNSQCENLCGMTFDGKVQTSCKIGTCFKYDCTNAKMKTHSGFTSEHNNGVKTFGDGKLSFWAEQVATCPTISCEATIGCSSCLSFSGNQILMSTNGQAWQESISMRCKYQDSYSNKNKLVSPVTIQMTNYGCKGDCPPNHESAYWCRAKNKCQKFDGLKWDSSTANENCENICGMDFSKVENKCSNHGSCLNYDCSNVQGAKQVSPSLDTRIVPRNTGTRRIGYKTYWCEDPGPTCPLQDGYESKKTPSKHTRFFEGYFEVDSNAGTDRQWASEIEIACKYQNSYSNKEYVAPGRNTIKVAVQWCSQSDLANPSIFEVYYNSWSAFPKTQCFKLDQTPQISLSEWNADPYHVRYKLPVPLTKGVSWCQLFRDPQMYYVSSSKTAFSPHDKVKISSSHIYLDNKLQMGDSYDYYIFPNSIAFNTGSQETQYYIGTNQKAFYIKPYFKLSQSFIDGFDKTITFNGGDEASIPLSNYVVFQYVTSDFVANCGSFKKLQLDNTKFQFFGTKSQSCEPSKDANKCTKIANYKMDRDEDIPGVYELGITFTTSEDVVEKLPIKLKLNFECEHEDVAMAPYPTGQTHHWLLVQGRQSKMIDLMDYFKYAKQYKKCPVTYSIVTNNDPGDSTFSDDSFALVDSNQFEAKLSLTGKPIVTEFFIKAKRTTKQAFTKIRLKVCGFETQSFNDDHGLTLEYIRDSWMDKILFDKEAFQKYFTYSNETDCPTEKIIVTDEQGKEIDFSDSAFVKVIRSQANDPLIEVIPNKITKEEYFSFKLGIVTSGLVTTYSPMISFKLHKMKDNCLRVIPLQTFGWSQHPQKRHFKADDPDNYLQKFLKESDLFVLQDQIEFVFPDFVWSNLTDVSSQTYTCEPIKYSAKLYNFPQEDWKLYESEDKKDKGDRAVAEFQFASINPFSLAPGNLPKSEAIKSGGTTSEHFDELIKSKNLTGPLYNVLVFNPQFQLMKNLTYVLEIETFVSYGKEIIYAKRVSEENLEPSYKYTWEFTVDSCKPKRFYDRSIGSVARSNQTNFTYFLNNGTEEYPSPFDGIFTYEQDCGNKYETWQSVNYTYSSFGLNEETVRKVFEFEYDPEELKSILRFKFTSYNQLGIHKFQMMYGVTNTEQPHKQYPTFNWFIEVNATNVKFEFDLAPYLSSQPKKTFIASNSTRLQPYRLPELQDPSNGTKTILINVEDLDGRKMVKYNKDQHSILFSDITMRMRTDYHFSLKMQMKESVGDNVNVTEYKMILECLYCRLQAYKPKVEIEQKVQKVKKKEVSLDKFYIPSKLEIKPVTNSGFLQLKFSKPMIYPERWSNVQRRLQESIKNDILIEVISSDTERETQPKLEWFVQLKTPTQLNIKILFENPLEISTYSQSEYDRLSVRFGEEFISEFVDEENRKPLDLSSYGSQGQITKKLPRQLPQTDGTDRLLSSADSTSGAVTTVVAGNMLLSFVMSFSMNYLWGMINCLQMIVYLPLLNLQFPTEPMVFLQVLVSVATFDVVPNIGDIIDSLFSFEASLDLVEKKSNGYQQIGFVTKNFIQNSGSLFIYVLIFIGFVLLSFISKRMSQADLGNTQIICTKIWRRYAIKGSYKTIILRFVMEGFIELLIGALFSFELTYKIDEIVKNPSDCFAYLISVCFLALALALPLISVICINRKLQIDEEQDSILIENSDTFKTLKKQNRALKKNWGFFYNDLKYRNPAALHYQYIYIMRRLTFVVIAYYFDDHTFFQIMLNCALTQFVISFNLATKPFQDSALNKQEIFNELTILLVSYCVFMISDWVPPEQQTQVGFVIIAVTSFNIFVNFSIMIYQIFRQFKISFYKKWYKREIKKAKKEIREKFKGPYELRDVHRAIRKKQPLWKIREQQAITRKAFLLEYCPEAIVDEPKYEKRGPENLGNVQESSAMHLNFLSADQRQDHGKYLDIMKQEQLEMLDRSKVEEESQRELQQTLDRQVELRNQIRMIDHEIELKKKEEKDLQRYQRQVRKTQRNKQAIQVLVSMVESEEWVI